jgi:molybdopterin/thiamine biosynthesis adenylyltransferase
MTIDLAFSRPLATAAALGEQARDPHRFQEKTVLLTGDAAFLSTANGRVCLRAALLLLVRTTRRGLVHLPEGMDDAADAYRAELADVGAQDWQVIVRDRPPDPDTFHATLSVGWRGRPTGWSDTWTVINSHGWLARVSSGPEDLITDFAQTNPIGALAAACLGVAEVFKTLLGLKEHRGKRLSRTTFNLFTYTTGGAAAGPHLPNHVELDAALCGAGAIGNGVAYLLNELPIGGRLRVVDRQTFGEENWGTCLLVRRSDIGRPKVERIAEVIGAGHPSVQVVAIHGDLSEIGTRIESGERRPHVVLSALDNVDARHGAQDIWPDLLIDGAIGDFPCQVSRHPWSEDVACARCLFRPAPGADAQLVASRATGLSEGRLLQADTPICEQDVIAAEPSRQAWLRERIGKTVCSVVQEGMARSLSTDDVEAHFRPSVPFVACMSAAMIVGELIKDAMGLSSPLAPRFQMDMLRGPSHGDHFPQQRRPDCLCVSRRGNIERLRSVRSTA